MRVLCKELSDTSRDHVRNFVDPFASETSLTSENYKQNNHLNNLEIVLRAYSSLNEETFKETYWNLIRTASFYHLTQQPFLFCSLSARQWPLQEGAVKNTGLALPPAPSWGLWYLPGGTGHQHSKGNYVIIKDSINTNFLSFYMIKRNHTSNMYISVLLGL